MEQLLKDIRETATIKHVMRNEPVIAERLAEVAPAILPETVRDTAEALLEKEERIALEAYAESREDLVAIAPFLDRDVLAELVEEGPYLDRESLEALHRF